MDVTMDNQQVKETDIAWLAGFTDGEGYIGISKSLSSGYVKYSPQIDIANTHLETVEQLKGILDSLGVTYHYRVTKPHPVHKQRHHLRISRMKSVKQFLLSVYPFLRTKKKQAELLAEFVNSRALSYVKITPRDHEIHASLKALNKKGVSKSSET